MIVKVQVAALPAHPPVQPVNKDPDGTLTVSVTEVFTLIAALHVGLQLIPPTLDVTVPNVPVPASTTVNVGFLKFAVTAVSLFIVRLHVRLDPVQSPLQLWKIYPAAVAGAAVRVTPVPAANWAKQVAPHEIGPGVDVTVPWPLPIVTESV